MQRLHGWDVTVSKISDYISNYENEVSIAMQENVWFRNLSGTLWYLHAGRLCYCWHKLNYFCWLTHCLLLKILFRGGVGLEGGKRLFSFFVAFFFFFFEQAATVFLENRVICCYPNPILIGRVRITADLTDLGRASAGCCRSFIITGHYVDFFPIREAPWECPHGTILYSTLLAVYFACHTVISGGWIMTSIFAMLCGLGLYQDKTG